MKLFASLLAFAVAATATPHLTPFYLKTTSNESDTSLYVNVDNINTSESYVTLIEDHLAALPFFWGNGTDIQIQSLFNYDGMSPFYPWAITLLMNSDDAPRVMITDHPQGDDFTVNDEDGTVGSTNENFSGFLSCGTWLRYTKPGGPSSVDGCEAVNLTVSAS